jgi:DNA-binding PadR family transcriptional regulator
VARTHDPAELLPLPHLTYLVLLAVARGDAHGWEIIRRIREITAGETNPSSGSLYLAMVRLEERGLLEELGPPVGEVEDGRGRRYYGLTGFGRRVLEAESARLAELVREAHRLGAVGAPPPSRRARGRA